MKKIDAHIHVSEYINGVGSRGELVPLGNGVVSYADGKEFRIIPEGLGDKEFKIETAIEVLNKFNVEKAVIVQGNYLGFQNLYAYKAMKENDRFVSACTYDPFSANRVSIAKHLFEDLGFKIVKLECSIGSGFMAIHNPFSLDCKEMREIYDYARKYNLVIVFDIGRPGSPSYQIDTLVKILKEYSDVNFVICHLLAHQENQMDLLKNNLPKFKLDNVYFDISSVINNTHENYPFPCATLYIKEAIKILGSDRLMWGTDMPAGICKNTYQENVDWIEKMGISDIDKENIFYNTANKVYFKNK